MDLSEGVRTVTSQGWLRSTSPEFQRAILSGCDCRPLEAGEPLQVGGEDHGEMIGLARGILALRTTLGPADTAISSSGVLAGLCPDTVQAAAQSRGERQDAGMACARSRGDNQKNSQGESSLVGFFLQPLLEYGDLTVTIAADLMIRDSERRCAAALLRLAGRRYASPRDVAPLEVPLTQNELAGAANLSRNSVGTMLQRLATRGFVEVGYGTITVRTPAPLRTFVDQG